MTLHWAVLAGAITVSVLGQTLLKAGAGTPGLLAQFVDLRTVIGLCLYGGAALLYIVALRRIPMSVALPFTAVSYVAAALIGHYGFGEVLGVARLAALGLICAGVLLLATAG
jgi:multidrug transporter EmrE-like cation transporter